MLSPVTSNSSFVRKFDFFEDRNDDFVFEIFYRKIKNLEWADVGSLRRTCKRFDHIGDAALIRTIYHKKNNETVYLKGATALRGLLRLCLKDKNPLTFSVDFQKNALKTILDAKDPKALFELVRLPGFVPVRDDFDALQKACKIGSAKAVCHLLQDDGVDPAADDNWAIRVACKYGHRKVVQLLLNDKRVDPAASDNSAIQLACKYGHTEVVQLLLNDKRVKPDSI